MKTFSRLSLLTLLFLGVAFMLVVDTVHAQHAQQDTLEVYTAGGQAEYNVGDEVEVSFVVRPTQVVPLQVDWQGVNITGITGATAPYAPGNYATDSTLGSLVIKGTIAAPNAYISALWDRSPADDLFARADLGSKAKAPRIVVNPPDVNGTGSSSPLAVGDTFTQEILARDFVHPPITDVSAWQMQITYNPKVLKFMGATEGDFLQGGVGAGTVFTHSTDNNGMVKAYQARIGETTDATVAPAVTTLTAPVAGVTGSGLLMTVEFKLLEFAEEALGLNNIQISNSQSPGTDITDAASQASRVSYHVVVNPIVATHKFPAVDVNRDGMVNVMDLVVISGALGTVPSDNSRADVNNDGFVNVLDLMLVASSSSWGKAVSPTSVRDANNSRGSAPPVHAAADITPQAIQGWLDLMQVEDDGSALFDLGIAKLETLLASKIPTETKLLLNYPNPFNPETWIPYQLAKATDVTVMIHTMNGSLVRTLELGHQAAGIYQSKSQAAYWDGRNELGEQVASGLYFYTLTAGDFSATAKMLVRK